MFDSDLKQEVKTKELNKDIQNLIIKTEACNKKSVYFFTKEDLKNFEWCQTTKEENEEKFFKYLIYLGQYSLNNGCDIFVFNNNMYLAESHDFDDFLDEDYEEECEYCYNVKKIEFIISSIEEKKKKIDSSNVF